MPGLLYCLLVAELRPSGFLERSKATATSVRVYGAAHVFLFH